MQFKQVNNAIQIQKLIRDIKHTLDNRIYDGYLLRIDKVKFNRIKQNIFIKGNFIDMQKERYECVFNIMFDENMGISDLTYDSEEQSLNVAATIANNLLAIVKEYFNQTVRLSPVRIEFVKLHNEAIRALGIGEAHLFNVKDENTTTPKSVIQGFEKRKVLFAYEPERYL